MNLQLVKEPPVQFTMRYDKPIVNDFQLIKESFLQNIKSPTGKTKYKRYIGSPLRYGGGKSLAVGHIIELLPDNVNRIVSPFFGGGSVEVACAKELGIEVLGFDVFDILMNYWQVQIKNPTLLFEELSKIKPTPENYVKVKKRLKKHWEGEKSLSPLDLAVAYYYNHNLSYGPGFLGWMSKIYHDENRYVLMLKKVKNFTAPKLKVKTAMFQDTIPKYKNDFLYCDPPYFLEGDSKMFRGIYPQRNFPIHHNNFDHKKLCELLKQHKGGFILSYNDCSTIREWYSDFKIIDVSWQYTMGQGETRIGFNRINGNRNHIKKSHEILIVKHG